MCYGHYSGEPARISIWLYNLMDGNSWEEPRALTFDAIERIGYQFIGPQDRLYFSGREPGDTRSSLFIADKTKTGWGVPEKIVFDVDDPPELSMGYPSVAASGNIYVQINLGGSENNGSGNADIYLSTFENGRYSVPVKMADTVNSQWHECHPYVAADESYLIFNSASYPEDEGFGSCDLYICFRDEQGNWQQAINMGATVNTEYSEGRPSGSWDGKYLFFASSRVDTSRFSVAPGSYEELIDLVHSPGNGLEDIYWVDTGVIEELRKK